MITPLAPMGAGILFVLPLRTKRYCGQRELHFQKMPKLFAPHYPISSNIKLTHKGIHN
jgi:hypothetical protein